MLILQIQQIYFHHHSVMISRPLFMVLRLVLSIINIVFIINLLIKLNFAYLNMTIPEQLLEMNYICDCLFTHAISCYLLHQLFHAYLDKSLLYRPSTFYYLVYIQYSAFICCVELEACYFICFCWIHNRHTQIREPFKSLCHIISHQHILEKLLPFTLHARYSTFSCNF